MPKVDYKAMETASKADCVIDFIMDGYFYEKDTFNMGYRLATKIKDVLYSKRSKYQDVVVFDTEKSGKILALDGAVQCSEFDEFAYQEMITFLPTNSHPNPSNVLVIGGGDGGVLRELDRHPLVKNATLCEIDEDVLTVCKQFLPGMAKGLDSPKASIIIQDGFDYLSTTEEKYDVIICDLTDPDGPSETLYTPGSISMMSKALKDDGILCLQSGCFWVNLSLISDLMRFCSQEFAVSKYATVYTPLYPPGQIGFLLASKHKSTNLEHPSFIMDPEKYGLKYYSPAIHTSAFVLPTFVQQALYPRTK